MTKTILLATHTVLGRLQSITCMKKYTSKYLEELCWEDYSVGRKAYSGLLCGKPEGEMMKVVIW